MNLSPIKKHLGVAEDDERWLAKDVRLAVSGVQGGSWAVAKDDRLALSSPHVDEGQPRLLHLPEGRPTALLVLSVAGASLTSRTQSHLTHHFVLVGHESGFVHVLSESGQLLIRRQFEEAPVLGFRLSPSLGPLGQRSSVMEVAHVPTLNDVLVVYGSVVVALGAQVLCHTLATNQARLAQSQAQGHSFLTEQDQSVSQMQVKRWLIKGQVIRDVGVSTYPNTFFDQMAQLSRSASALEGNLKSLAHITHVVSVGQDPTIRFNSPYNVHAQDINELAEHVVSTVKSGFMRVAGGLLWGGKTETKATEDRPAVRDLEQKLSLNFALKDGAKEGCTVEVSPNALYMAIADNQNRVILVECVSGIVIHVWKGLHHAQIGWSVSKPEPSEQMDDEDEKLACFLVIYLPRRGTLEVWFPESKQKLAEFAVSKHGVLVPCSNGILDPTSRSRHLRDQDLVFFGQDGTLTRIVIPTRCLNSRGKSNRYTAYQQEQILALMDENPMTDATQSKIGEKVLSASSGFTQVCMLLDILKSAQVQRKLVDQILADLSDQIKERECSASSPVERCKNAVRDLMVLHSMMASVESDPEFTNVEPISGLEQLHILQELDATEKEGLTSRSPPSLPAFIRAWRLNVDMFDTATSDPIRLQLLNRENPEVLHAFLALGLSRPVQLLDGLKSLGAHWEQLLTFLCQGIIKMPPERINIWSSSVLALFQLVFDFSQWDEAKASQFYHTTRKQLINAPMCPSQLLLSFVWNEFAANEDAFESLYVDSERILELTQSYLRLEKAFEQHLLSDNSTQELRSFNDVFEVGNGRVSELMSQWLVRCHLLPKALDAEESDVRLFLNLAEMEFPKSSQTKTLLSHMAWEYMRSWVANREDLSLLASSHDCLAALYRLDGVELSLAHLIWRTFLHKLSRDAVNVTEIRSPTRCLREVGVPEDQLSQLLHVCVKILCLMIQHDQRESHPTEDEKQKGTSSTNYDTISTSSKLHLLDHSSSCSINLDVLALQYQYLQVANLVWEFSLNIKPMTLFSSQESNIFFQSEASTQLGLLISMGQNVPLRQTRKQFLELACQGAVGTIHLLPTEDGRGRWDTLVFKNWMSHLQLLAKMWFLSDKFKEYQVLSLYSGGHDSLGQELFSCYPDRESLATRLIHIALLRVTKFVYESDDHNRRLASVKPDLLLKLSQLQAEASRLTSVDVQDTKSLMIALCGLKLEEEIIQVIYDCLALVQMFMK